MAEAEGAKGAPRAPSAKAARRARSRRVARVAVVVLAVAGAVLVGLRLLLADPSRLPAGDTAWVLDATIRVDAEAGAVLRIAMPRETRAARILSRSFEHPGFRLQRARVAGPADDLAAVAVRDGLLAFRGEFRVHVAALPEGTSNRPPLNRLPAAERARWLESTPGIEVDGPVAAATVASVATTGDPSRQERLTRLFQHVADRIATDPRSGVEDSETALRDGRATVLGKARALAALCRTARIPAAVTAGFVLAEHPIADPHFWVEARLAGVWTPMDPEFGFLGELPPRHLPFTRGRTAIAQIEEVGAVGASFSVSRLPVPSELRGPGANAFEILDFSRLPLATRDTLVWLLVMPLGVLVTAFFQLLVGIRTFGTFTPTLLALSALAVDWRTAAVILVLVAVFGIAGRAVLPELALKRTPRLAIVFGLVALSMTVGLSVMDYLEWTAGGTLVLLPMVVLANLVDRVYTVADEDGLLVTLVRLGWTLVVTVACALLFLAPDIGAVLLRFPELHAFTAAAIIGMASYGGATLRELRYGKWLAEPESEAPPRPRKNRPGGKRKPQRRDRPAPEVTP